MIQKLFKKKNLHLKLEPAELLFLANIWYSQNLYCHWISWNFDLSGCGHKIYSRNIKMKCVCILIGLTMMVCVTSANPIFFGKPMQMTVSVSSSYDKSAFTSMIRFVWKTNWAKILHFKFFISSNIIQLKLKLLGSLLNQKNNFSYSAKTSWFNKPSSVDTSSSGNTDDDSFDSIDSIDEDFNTVDTSSSSSSSSSGSLSIGNSIDGESSHIEEETPETPNKMYLPPY